MDLSQERRERQQREHQERRQQMHDHMQRTQEMLKRQQREHQRALDWYYNPPLPHGVYDHLWLWNWEWYWFDPQQNERQRCESPQHHQQMHDSLPSSLN